MPLHYVACWRSAAHWYFLGKVLWRLTGVYFFGAGFCERSIICRAKRSRCVKFRSKVLPKWKQNAFIRERFVHVRCIFYSHPLQIMEIAALACSQTIYPPLMSLAHTYYRLSGHKISTFISKAVRILCVMLYFKDICLNKRENVSFDTYVGGKKVWNWFQCEFSCL